MITLENTRLAKLITEKDLLVTEGRKITRDIEGIESKIKAFENKEKAITSKVKAPKDLEEKGNQLTVDINKLILELDKIGNQIENAKLDAIPKELKDFHVQAMKDKEVKERERNKVALKIQKIKDKVVPLIQKEVKPFLLDDFDDIETAKVKNGKVEISTFNHLADFKSKFKKR